MLISFVRGTPLLIQIFIFFYVLPAAGLNLSAITTGVAALAFNSMVFVSEILRAGLGTLDPGQVEAGRRLACALPQYGVTSSCPKYCDEHCQCW